MFGWGDEFTYFECASCGCLQISEVPADLGRYYPSNYYSFQLQSVPQQGLKSQLARIRDYLAATQPGIIGRLLARISVLRRDLTSLAFTGVKKNSKMLDVGCGRGELLSRLHRAGFRALAGVDPFLAEEVVVVPGVVVQKKQLAEVQGEFDLIMLHHVLEHLEFPKQFLADCRSKLTKNGKLLLRFPTVDSFAWRKYRTNWVQLDAPRHVFLHSYKSIERLARETGMAVEKIWCDSEAFQFFGSEHYEKGRPLLENGQYLAGSLNPEQLRRYEQEARRLNRLKQGDQIAVILTAV